MERTNWTDQDVLTLGRNHAHDFSVATPLIEPEPGDPEPMREWFLYNTLEAIRHVTDHFYVYTIATRRGQLPTQGNEAFFRTIDHDLESLLDRLYTSITMSHRDNNHDVDSLKSRFFEMLTKLIKTNPPPANITEIRERILGIIVFVQIYIVEREKRANGDLSFLRFTAPWDDPEVDAERVSRIERLSTLATASNARLTDRQRQRLAEEQRHLEEQRPILERLTAESIRSDSRSNRRSVRRSR